jgi:hypothetical protein
VESVVAYPAIVATLQHRNLNDDRSDTKGNSYG